MGRPASRQSRADPVLDRAVRADRAVSRLRGRRHRARPRCPGCSTSTASRAARRCGRSALQAYHSSAYYGAIATMCALFARDRDGRRPVDRPQHAGGDGVRGRARRGQLSSATGEIEPRRGTLHWSRFFRVGKCRDGYIMHCTLGDWTSLVEWVKADGKAQDLDRRPNGRTCYSARGCRASVRRARRMGQGLLARRIARTRAASAPAVRDSCANPRLCSTTSNSLARGYFARGRASRTRPHVPLSGRAVRFQRYRRGA